MRLAYVSHVDSRWIKQRPHFIAEAMSSDQTFVAYVCSLFVRRRLLVTTQALNIPVVRVPILPQRLRQRLRLLDPFSSAISAMLIGVLIRPNAVVFTHSRHWRVARFLKFAGVRIFYDCMDLNGLFPDASADDRNDERRLVEISESVFCSSELIAEHIRGIHRPINTINVPNALQPEIFQRFETERPSVERDVVGYVGAISSWFDFNAVMTLLDRLPNLTVRLWGPSDVAIPRHDRLEVMGVVAHDDAVEAMHTCGVLILPFVLSELILAVDPVKVYEYISTGRPTIVRDYPQLDSFGPLVHRYVTQDEFVEKIVIALDQEPLDRTKITEFMDGNSWDRRAALMLKGIS